MAATEVWLPRMATKAATGIRLPQLTTSLPLGADTAPCEVIFQRLVAVAVHLFRLPRERTTFVESMIAIGDGLAAC